MKVSIAIGIVGALAGGGMFLWSEGGFAQGQPKTPPLASSAAEIAQAAPKSQTPPAAQPKAPAAKAAPKPTAKIGDKFGDWTYQCDNPQAGTECYISQSRVTTNESGEQARVLLVNVSRIGTERRPVLYVFLPFGSAVQQDIAVSVDAGGVGFKGRVDTCLTMGCRVPFVMADDVQDLLRKGKTMFVSFAPVGGKPVRVEVPLAGFTAGLAAVN